MSKSNALESMVGIVVYKGKVYTFTGTDIDIDSAYKIMGDKLGTTKGNIDEWSSKEAYATELASNFTGDIYTVKGYDSNFRIMGISSGIESTERKAVLFECCNGITISDGEDILGKLKMQGNALNITYVQYCDFETPIYTVNDDTLMNCFVNSLNKATPYLLNINWNKRSEIRKIKVRLKDGCDVGLTLIKGGYIIYGNCDVSFKIDNSTFNKLWNKLDYSKDISIIKDESVSDNS